MTLDWFVWYGLQIGLTYTDTLDLPFAELLNLVAIEQIKHEGAKRLVVLTEEEAFDFMDEWGGDE